MEHPGRCHCGALGFVLASEVPLTSWQVRACQCAFCRAHSALSVSDPKGALRFTHRDPSRLQRYQFALRTADFLLCRDCGVYIAAVTRDGKHGIINTRALVDQAGLREPEPMVYDGESEDTRLARRAERWTPVV